MLKIKFKWMNRTMHRSMHKEKESAAKKFLPRNYKQSITYISSLTVFLTSCKLTNFYTLILATLFFNQWPKFLHIGGFWRKLSSDSMQKAQLNYERCWTVRPGTNYKNLTIGFAIVRAKSGQLTKIKLHDKRDVDLCLIRH